MEKQVALLHDLYANGELTWQGWLALGAACEVAMSKKKERISPSFRRSLKMLMDISDAAVWADEEEE